MISRLIILLVILSACSLIQVESSRYRSKFYCRNTSIAAEDLSDEVENIVNDLWTISLSDWSPLANEFKGELQVLRRSDSDELSNYAAVNILFFSILNPYLDEEISGCAPASIINGSISCIVDGDNTPIYNEIFNIIGSYYGQGTNYAYCNGLDNLGCPISKEDEEFCSIGADWKCENNGLIYDIDKMWDLRGQNLPDSTREIVKELYESDNFRDRYIALIATYTLTDFSDQVFLGFNPLTLYELLYLQIGPHYPEDCCNERLARMRYLRDTTTIQRKASFQKLADFYASPKACKKRKC